MSQHIDGKKIMALTTLLKKVGADGAVLDKILKEPGVLLDLLNPNANIKNICRHQFRAMLELPGLIEVNCQITMEMIFERFDLIEGPLDKVLDSLNGEKSCCKEKHLLEFEELQFSDSISTKKAADIIKSSNDRWKPFELKHLVAYMERNSQKTIHSPTVACGQIIMIDEKQYVAVAGYSKKKFILYVVPAHGHKWAANTHFPKYRSLIG